MAVPILVFFFVFAFALVIVFAFVFGFRRFAFRIFGISRITLYVVFNHCVLRRETKQRWRGQCVISTGTHRYLGAGRRHVYLWPLADVPLALMNFRFRGKADISIALTYIRL